MTLPDSVVNYYDSKVLQAFDDTLVAVDLIFKGDDLPAGTGTVTRRAVDKPTGKAKRGYRVRTVPREVGERGQKTVTVVEHVHGFDLHRKELQAYEREGTSALNGADASNSGRLVAESLDDIILNGDANQGVKGIFKDAGQTAYGVPAGYEWNKQTTRNPLDNFIDALEQFEASGLYTARKVALAPRPYRLAFKMDHSGAIYMEEIAKLIPGGMDSIKKTPRIDSDKGLICDFGEQIAERNVEEEINTLDFPLTRDSLYPFNVETYQATDIHKLDGFMQLNNLVDLTP